MDKELTIESKREFESAEEAGEYIEKVMKEFYEYHEWIDFVTEEKVPIHDKRVILNFRFDHPEYSDIQFFIDGKEETTGNTLWTKKS